LKNSVYFMLGFITMTTGLLVELKKLQHQRSDSSPFANHVEFHAWADKVLPLLSFDQKLYNRFRSIVQATNSAHALKVELQEIENINSAIGILNQAITLLEINPVPHSASDPSTAGASNNVLPVGHTPWDVIAIILKSRSALLWLLFISWLLLASVGVAFYYKYITISGKEQPSEPVGWYWYVSDLGTLRECGDSTIRALKSTSATSIGNPNEDQVTIGRGAGYNKATAYILCAAVDNKTVAFISVSGTDDSNVKTVSTQLREFMKSTRTVFE
jgi:hypothetical protein